MKKNTYWFSKLSEQEQVEFKENLLAYRKTEEFFEEKSFSFYQFVGGAFVWVDTKQGLFYWSEISLRNVK